MVDQQQSRSVETTRKKILAAAAEVGSRVGFAKATTKAISEAAGVNEVTIFRHFGSKERLFSAAIEEYGGPALVPIIEAQFSGNFREDMLMMGRFFFDILRKRREMLRFLLCESAHIPEVRTILARNPRELRQMLAKYLENQMQAGVVKPGHPEAMAQAFLGMFFSYAISVDVLKETVSPKIEPDELVIQFVEIFISGTALH